MFTGAKASSPRLRRMWCVRRHTLRATARQARLCPDEDRGELSDAVKTLLEGPTAWLRLGKPHQVGIEGRELSVQGIDHVKPCRDDVAAGG
jgi:hypothetical protein